MHLAPPSLTIAACTYPYPQTVLPDLAGHPDEQSTMTSILYHHLPSAAIPNIHSKDLGRSPAVSRPFIKFPFLPEYSASNQSTYRWLEAKSNQPLTTIHPEPIANWTPRIPPRPSKTRT